MGYCERLEGDKPVRDARAAKSQRHAGSRGASAGSSCMYKKVLVNELISEGKQLLEALRRNRFSFTAAFWYYFPDALEWRLVIVSPTVDRSGPLAAYQR